MSARPGVDGDTELELGAGLLGRVDEQRVEDGALRGVQRSTSGHRNGLVAVVERHLVDGRGAGRREPVEQPPAVEQLDAGRHERVGGQRVRTPAGVVQDEDAVAATGELEGGGGSGQQDPDDDGVIAFHGRWALLVVVVEVGGAWTAPPSRVVDRCGVRRRRP